EVIPALGHNFTKTELQDATTLVSEATCTSPAIYHKTCSRCDAVSTDEIDTYGVGEKLYHHYNTDFEWNIDHTICTATFTCPTCNDVKQKVVNGAADGLSSTTTATCETPGRKTFSAEFVLDYDDLAPSDYGKVYTAKDTVVEPALGHAFESAPEFEWRQEENGWKGYATVKCTRDEDHVINLTTSTTGEITTPATCTTAGKTTYTAAATYQGQEFKDTKEVENIAALNHDYGEPEFVWSSDYLSAKLVYTCTRNENHKLEYPATVNVERTDATCTDAGNVKYTATYGTFRDVVNVPIQALGHAWADDFTVDRQPTCTVAGSKSVHCTRCEATQYPQVINALGHDLRDAVVENSVAPTCTQAGHYDSVVYCDRCENEITRDNIEVKALGHNPREAVKENNVETTCTHAGSYDMVVYCDRCEEELDRDHEVVAKLEHTWNAGEVAIEPTCTKRGLRLYTCTVCEEERKEFIDPLGHDFNDYVSDNNASLTEDGTKTAHCDRDCGATDTIVDEGSRIAKSNEEAEKVVSNDVDTQDVGDGTVKTKYNYQSTENVELEGLVKNFTVGNASELLTEEETGKVDNGDDAVIYLESQILDSISDAESELVETAAKGYSNGVLMDLSVFKKVGEQPKVRITDTKGVMFEFELEIPAGLRNTNTAVERSYSVIRIHDGKATVLPTTYNASNKSLKFSSDKYSTYVLAYKDTKIEVKTADVTPTTPEQASSEELTNDITNGKNTEEIQGSSFGLLKAVAKNIKKKQFTLTWNKVAGADGFIIYGARCNSGGKKYKMQEVATVSKNVTSKTIKNLKKATFYKYAVVAYKAVDGKKKKVAASVTTHIVTKGSKYGVAKKVTLQKIGKTKIKDKTKATVKLAKGKTALIKAKEVKEDKPIKQHRKVCYESSNQKVATVSKAGKIKAVGKGTCKIWVYAQNGVYATITVKVK
nr:fibronectin type III domain-containing protein [Lachnospiraceae bacterium]